MRHETDFGSHDGRREHVQLLQVGVGVALQDRVSRMVPVGHPLPDRGPPVFEQELLRVLFAVAAPVPTLGSGLADLELTMEVDLEFDWVWSLSGKKSPYKNDEKYT